MAQAPQAATTFAELLKNSKVRDVVTPNRNVITVNSDESPLEGFKRIVKSHILSAPVWDKAANQWIGFLDTRDLVSFVVFQAEEMEKKHAPASNTLAPPPQDLRTIFDAAAKFYHEPTDGLTTSYLAKRNRFIPVHMDDSLFKVAEILAAGGAHRVPVIDPKDPSKIIDVVSQSTLINFFYKNRAALAKEMQLKLSDIKIGSRPVIPVNEHTTALETFKIMAKYNRSGIAVVDDRGTFVGNTSASDLKLFIQSPEKYFYSLKRPILDFLAAIRRAEIVDNPNTRSPTIGVSQHATLEKIIGKLSATKVHRLFVADDESGYKPVAVVSITDVLRYIVGNVAHQQHPNSPVVVVQSS